MLPRLLYDFSVTLFAAQYKQVVFIWYPIQAYMIVVDKAECVYIVQGIQYAVFNLHGFGRAHAACRGDIFKRYAVVYTRCVIFYAAVQEVATRVAGDFLCGNVQDDRRHLFDIDGGAVDLDDVPVTVEQLS